MCLEREREREMESVCREREGVCFEIETEGVCVAIEREGMCMEREREVEIERVQNDRNVFMSRDRERREIESVCVYV